MATPAIMALRNLYPQAKICLLTNPRSVDIIRGLCNNPLNPMTSPEMRSKGNLTHSRAIIMACKPYEWIEEEIKYTYERHLGGGEYSLGFVKDRLKRRKEQPEESAIFDME